MTMPQNCKRCAREIYPRMQPRPDAVEHSTRGLCRACRRAAELDGTLFNYPPLQGGRPPGNVVEDFEFIAQTSNGKPIAGPLRYDRQTRENAAERIGVKRKSLDSALYREARRSA